MKLKVILATNGPLHLIKSAEYLSPFVDILVIQGWIPSWWNIWLLSIASSIQKRNIYKTIKKRTPSCLKGRNIGLAIPDFYFWGCRLFHLSNSEKASLNSARLFGKFQKPYLKNADIYHVRSGSGASGAIDLARKNGMKILVDHSIAHPAFMDLQLRTEYEKNGESFDLGLDNAFWTEIVEECQKADIILVNSQFVKKTFIEQGFSPDRIKVVYLGVRADFQNLKKEYSLQNDTLHILFTGGFGFRKGAEYILKALCELDKERFNYEFTVVGDYSGITKLIEKYCPRNINFVNTVPQDKLKDYLSNTDVYLFPSLCEGCASSGMEAMAAGLPVIATIESGLPITHEKNGIIIESKSVTEIIDSLRRIASNKHLREELGRNASKLISQNYTWETYANNVLSLYNEM